MAKSYAPIITGLTNGVTNCLVYGTLQPIFNGYGQLLNTLEEKKESFNDETTKEDVLNAQLEAVDVFSHDSVRSLINGAIENLGNMFMSEADENWIKQNHPALYKDMESFSIPTSEILKIKNQLMMAFSPLNTVFQEMDRSQRSITAKLQTYNDSGRSVKSGWSGGMIGGAIGTMLLPGIGSIIGGVIGGALVTNNQDENIIDSINEDINSYFVGCDKIHAFCINNIKLISNCFNDASKVIFANDRKIYISLQGKYPNLNDIFYDYYSYELNQLNESMNSISEGNEQSCAKNLEDFFEYVKECQKQNLEAA